MRTATVFALSCLTLAGSVTMTEARGFRLRGHGSAAPHRPQPSRTPTVSSVPTIATVGAIGLFDPARGGANLVTRSVLTAGSGAADETAPIPPMPPAPAASPKPAEPWCRSGRIAGTGEGFCEIN